MITYNVTFKNGKKSINLTKNSNIEQYIERKYGKNYHELIMMNKEEFASFLKTILDDSTIDDDIRNIIIQYIIKMSRYHLKRNEIINNRYIGKKRVEKYNNMPLVYFN